MRCSVPHSCHLSNPCLSSSSSSLLHNPSKLSHATSSHPLASITILILSSHLSPCLPRVPLLQVVLLKLNFSRHTRIHVHPPHPPTMRHAPTSCTDKKRSLRHRNGQGLIVFKEAPMLKCPFLSHDPNSDLTSPYHLLIVFFKTFY